MEQVIKPEEFKYTDYIRLFEKYEELEKSEQDKLEKVLLLLNKITSLQRELKAVENKSFWDYIEFRKKNRAGENSDLLTV